MSKVTADVEKNRLDISLTGNICKEEVERIFADIRECVPKMEPGFSVVTDLTQCTIGHLNARPVFQQIVEFLLEKKVGKVIRVVGRSKIIFNQLSRITEYLKGYKPIYVSSLKEAEEHLSPGKEDQS